MSLQLCAACEDPYCADCWEPCTHDTEPLCRECSSDPRLACWECADDAAGQRDNDYLRRK
jgi:hypothetical protein